MSSTPFIKRHLGPRETQIKEMLSVIGASSIEQLINETIPRDIRMDHPLHLPSAMSEESYLLHINELASANKIYKTFIGMGYYDTLMPAVIQRNILENPAWYTSYTPYQPEISQGRLEALLNFQTVVTELTGMPVANASLLDESTASAEAMSMMFAMRTKEQQKANASVLLVDENIFPQTLDVLRTHSQPLAITIKTGHFEDLTFDSSVFGVILQYPCADGKIRDYSGFVKTAHEHKLRVAIGADLLSLCMLVPPGEWGADIVFGSSQRFGIPMGFGGPYAAYFATTDECKRYMPGRIIGVTVDRRNKLALRMSLQTREQHIKRERATSNICTAQALLATLAGMYAVYHGHSGLSAICLQIHSIASTLSWYLKKFGYDQENENFFDTLKIHIPDPLSLNLIQQLALERKINFGYRNEYILISIDETTETNDVNHILEVFAIASKKKYLPLNEIPDFLSLDNRYRRKSPFMQQSVFNLYHSETEMMRYIKRLEHKDFSLADGMIPLGSCTMKLNAAAEMMPITLSGFTQIHPFAPLDQAEGYYELIFHLGRFLQAITGFDGVSFQPNSGAAGEYTGLMVIRKYHQSKNQQHRNIALIPASAHGTNPASAVAAGMEVIVVPCDEKGNIDKNKFEQLVHEHSSNLAVFMVTYPSTHGVFEPDIRSMAALVHANGGQVYMDGANMNAQLGLTSPSIIGADVCHINLHKTFAIPHGGGGPGMGPIVVAEHLVEFLPTHPMIATGGKNGISAVSAAPYGSANILPISYGYCMMAGGDGLRTSSEYAILNANYIAARLKEYYPIVYTNVQGRVAHEMILDCRHLKHTGITETDIAKRLMDYGFHAPTLSFPVHGTLMVEPTESETKEELDRFIDAMINIYNEIKAIETAQADKEDNVLKNAPHTAEEVTADEWNHKYSRQQAAYPVEWLRERKFWPATSRVNDAWGDRNLICSCTPLDEYRKQLMVR